MKIALVDKKDTYNFVVGPARIRTKSGGWRLEKWYDRLWQRISKPFRTYDVVTDVNHELGTITLKHVKRWWHFLS